jgi:hypothetical protein
MKEYEVWSEGYCCTGCEGKPVTATFEGSVKAESFEEACDILFKGRDDYVNGRIWGCRLFDNEEDARKGFG